MSEYPAGLRRNPQDARGGSWKGRMVSGKGNDWRRAKCNRLGAPTAQRDVKTGVSRTFFRPSLRLSARQDLRSLKLSPYTVASYECPVPAIGPRRDAARMVAH